MDGFGKIAVFPNEFRESSSRVPRSPNGVQSRLRKAGGGLMVQLPMVVVDEFLDGFPSWTTKSNGRIPEIDETGNLNVFGDP